MRILVWLILFIATQLQSAAGDDRQAVRDLPSAGGPVPSAQRTATIHWQAVPLSDALVRLEKLFDESIYLDRRVDPSKRVSLEIQASNVEEVLTPIAAENDWGVSRLGPLVYVGPRAAAERLRAVAATRLQEVSGMTQAQGSALLRERRLTWPRLTEPRGLVSSLFEQNEWRVTEGERIPHDLWPAGDLPELALVEQVTVLLLGFDLTFAIRPKERLVEIVPLDKSKIIASGDGLEPRPGPRRSDPLPKETKQVYSLRVAEKPVGAVLHELARRLNWEVEIDEAAIRAAGKSLDKRVSFAVDNVEQDALLEALLRPAGLTFQREGERIKIVPREDASE